MAPRWLARVRARKAPAPSAGAPSPAAPPDPKPTLPTAGSSPSARTTGSSTPAVPSPASHAVRAESYPASWTDPRDTGELAARLARDAHAPPPLGELPDSTMLAVASVPGRLPEQWRPATLYAWMAWPHAADAWVHAMEMTAGQLRELLAGRDHG